MDREAVRVRKSIIIPFLFIALLWTVKLAEYAFDYDLGLLGIYPRTLYGTIGIITGPLVHGDLLHLITNSFPIIILGVGIFYFYQRIAWQVILLVYMMTGLWVWIAARPAYHIGASGLVYGLLFFLLVSGFLKKDRRALVISFIVIFLYGSSLFTGIIPTEEHISWESHLMGAIAGIFCAIYFRKEPLSSDEGLIDFQDEPDILGSPNAGIAYNYQYEIKTTKRSEVENDNEKKSTSFYYKLDLGDNSSEQKEQDQ
ncbi:MAG: rhomboid family intramembrane serine protease [Bacteroidota bacterium]